MLDPARLGAAGPDTAAVDAGASDARERDLDAVVAALAAEGVRIVTPPHEIFEHRDATLGRTGTVERMAFIEDSEGKTIALVERRPRATS